MPQRKPTPGRRVPQAFERFESAPHPPRPFPSTGHYRARIRDNFDSQPPPFERSENLGEAS